MKKNLSIIVITGCFFLYGKAGAEINCQTLPSCSSLGYTDTIKNCAGNRLVCPFDATQGLCIKDADPGDVKYSVKDELGNGWLKCDGTKYSKIMYPQLYAAIGNNFGGSGNIFKVPDYRGYFLRVKGTSAALNNNIYTAQADGLPNLSGTSSIVFYDANNSLSTSGVFSSSNVGTAGYDSGKYNLGQGTITFSASNYNSIYGKSSYVTPRNYALNAFIYGGNKGVTADNINYASCTTGSYYYADGSCSTTYSSSKGLLGIIMNKSQASATGKTTLTYISGGAAAPGMAINQGAASGNLASAAYIGYLQTANISSSAASELGITIPTSSMYFYTSSSSTYAYKCTDGSCTSYAALPNTMSPYFYFYYISTDTYIK